MYHYKYYCKYKYYCNLLYRQGCFTGKYTTRKIHTKLHPGLKWRISISSLMSILMTSFPALSQSFGANSR